MSRFHAEFGSAELEFRILRLYSRQSCITHATTPEVTSIKTSDEVEIPIFCDLYHKFHTEKPYYQALSYTWGDANDTVPVYVNNYRHKVTRNLYEALKHIRRDTEDVHIWTDALCINQDDDAEKGEQVKKMRSIYADAAETIAWLGPSPAGDSLGNTMTELNRIGKFVYESGMLDTMIKFAMLSSDDQVGYQTTEQEIKSVLADFLEESLNDLPKTQKMLEGFAALLSQPYWERVWILQEIVVSPTVLIQVGHSTIQFQHFYAVHMYMSYMSGQVALNIHSRLTALLASSSDTEVFQLLYKQFMDICAINIPKAAGRIAGMRRNHQRYLENDPSAKIPPGMTQLLAKVFVDHTPKATHDKDRIYALLGMASDVEILGIEPDYSSGLSVMDVYAHVAKALVSNGYVDFLSFSQNEREEKKIGPSWVPDWRRTIYRPSGQLPWDSLFCACGSQEHTLPENPGSLSTNQIKLSGFVVDKIQTLAPTLWTPGEDGVTKQHAAVSTYLSQIITLCNLAEAKLTSPTKSSPTSDSGKIQLPSLHDRKTAYYRIPVADQEEYGIGFIRRATSDLYPSYRAVVEELRVNGHALGVPTPEASDEGSGSGSESTEQIPSGRYYNVLGWQRNRHAFMSENGFVGLGPVGIKENDVIVILKGGKFPYILREVRMAEGAEDDLKYYELVGEAYVHGIMYGEVFPKQGKSELELEEKKFILI